MQDQPTSDEARFGARRVAVGAAVVVRPKRPGERPRLLVVQRRPQERLLPDHAELPGGTMEVPETSLEAVAREFREEIGPDIDFSEAEIVDAFDYPLPVWGGRPVYVTHMTWLLVVDEEFEVKLTEATRHWFIADMDELDEIVRGGVPITNEMKRAIGKVFDRLRERGLT